MDAVIFSRHPLSNGTEWRFSLGRSYILSDVKAPRPLRERKKEATRRTFLEEANRLFHQKGHEYVIEAARIVCAKEPRARFVFVGDGVLRPMYEARIRQLGLADRFLFTGLLAPEAVPAAMQAMDISVLTSHREGLARVIPQAHAVGKPVISFALDGSLDCIEDGVSGFLTKPHDADEVAARILELLPDEPRRRAMGEAGRRFAAANFPVEVMVERTNEVYYRVAAEGRRGRRRIGG